MPTNPSRARRALRLTHLARLFGAALVLISGCRSPYPLYVEHRPGDAPKAAPVPYATTYLLQSVDETDTGVTLLQRCAIQDQFQVGFIREADGGLVAYAGGRKFPLPEGHYVWAIAPDAEKTRAGVARANAGPVIATAGEALVDVGTVVAGLAGLMLYGFASSGGHN